MIRASSASETARASARRRGARRLSKPLDRLSYDGRNLRRSNDLRRENSNLTLAFEPRAERGVLSLKSLDAFEQIAGSAIQSPSIAAFE